MSAKLYTCHVANVSVAIDDFRDLLAYVHDLRCRIATAPTMSEAPLTDASLWRHIKSTGVYQIITDAFDEATGETLVVYRNRSTGETWVRPHKTFHDGRFERIDRAAAKGESDGPASD